MTTIRVTRRSSAGSEDAETPAGRPGAVRLELIDPVSARTTLDGAWWPRSSDLTTELAPLLEELFSTDPPAGYNGAGGVP